MESGMLKRFSEELKVYIVGEVESGNVSLAAASKEYGVPKTTVKNWLKEYGSFQTFFAALESTELIAGRDSVAKSTKFSHPEF